MVAAQASVISNPGPVAGMSLRVCPDLAVGTRNSPRLGGARPLPNHVAALDFNADATTDLVVANERGESFNLLFTFAPRVCHPSRASVASFHYSTASSSELPTQTVTPLAS